MSQTNITAKINLKQMTELQQVCEKNFLKRNAFLESIMLQMVKDGKKIYENRLPDETLFAWGNAAQFSFALEKETDDLVVAFCKGKAISRNVFIWFVIEKAKQVKLSFS